MRRNRWRSCKDRMPHKPKLWSDGYLIQDSEVSEPYSAFWDGERWTDDHGIVIETVIAWRKLPKEYIPREGKHD